MVLVQGSPCGKVIFSSCSFKEAAFAESQDMLQPGVPESMEKAIVSVWVFLYSVLLMETFSALIFSAQAAVCAQETGNLFPCPHSSRKQVNRSPVLELAQQGWLWRREELRPGWGCWCWSCVQRVLWGRGAALGCPSAAQHKELRGWGG